MSSSEYLYHKNKIYFDTKTIIVATFSFQSPYWQWAKQRQRERARENCISVSIKCNSMLKYIAKYVYNYNHNLSEVTRRRKLCNPRQRSLDLSRWNINANSTQYTESILCWGNLTTKHIICTCMYIFPLQPRWLPQKTPPQKHDTRV